MWGKTRLTGLDRLLGSRLRHCVWKSWKRIRTRIRNLIKLGLPEWLTVKWGFTRKGVARSPKPGSSNYHYQRTVSEEGGVNSGHLQTLQPCLTNRRIPADIPKVREWCEGVAIRKYFVSCSTRLCVTKEKSVNYQNLQI